MQNKFSRALPQNIPGECEDPADGSGGSILVFSPSPPSIWPEGRISKRSCLLFIVVPTKPNLVVGDLSPTTSPKPSSRGALYRTVQGDEVIHNMKIFFYRDRFTPLCGVRDDGRGNAELLMNGVKS